MKQIAAQMKTSNRLIPDVNVSEILTMMTRTMFQNFHHPKLVHRSKLLESATVNYFDERKW